MPLMPLCPYTLMPTFLFIYNYNLSYLCSLALSFSSSFRFFLTPFPSFLVPFFKVTSPTFSVLSLIFLQTHNCPHSPH